MSWTGDERNQVPIVSMLYRSKMRRIREGPVSNAHWAHKFCLLTWRSLGMFFKTRSSGVDKHWEVKEKRSVWLPEKLWFWPVGILPSITGPYWPLHTPLFHTQAVRVPWTRPCPTCLRAVVMEHSWYSLNDKTIVLDIYVRHCCSSESQPVHWDRSVGVSNNLFTGITY